MKKVLSAIGGFFARIWRWIAETAWIQPLLIVGLIFGVIFSIPTVSEWINDASDKAGQYDYYNRNQIKTTELLKCFENDDFSPLLENKGADRGLLVFIEEDCSQCISQEDAFKIFAKKDTWNHDDKQKVAPAVHFVYVDHDEDEIDDDKYAKAYYDLLNIYNMDEQVQIAYLATENSAIGVVPSDSDWVGEDSVIRIPTPTIAYFTSEGVTNAIMGLNGESSAEQAEYLRDFYYGINDWAL